MCKAIVSALRDCIKVPKNEKEWDDVDKRFYSKWNYPNCIGALDGKHIVLQAPANSGSLYYNYKGSFSVVLMALCEADYNFLYVDVGVQGLEQNTLQIPPKRVLPGRNVDMPFVIVADDAFAMSERIMKQFVGRHSKGSIERAFNYRHSRARRCNPKQQETYSSVNVVDSEDDNGNVINGTWRNDGVELPGLRWCKQRGENPGKFARQEMAHFFQSQPLPWQHHYA
ncbi:hypothetical protein JTB14_008182 [Gonioctena quinquepunctata]|nr:hypothetical protein JTB14_008182 [Gonioctena quinquepunctata]